MLKIYFAVCISMSTRFCLVNMHFELLVHHENNGSLMGVGKGGGVDFYNTPSIIFGDFELKYKTNINKVENL